MSVTEERPQQDTDDEISVRFGDIVQFIKDSRRTVFFGALAGLVIGVLYGLSKPNQYTSYVTVMPELQTRAPSGMGSIGSLAGLAGISLDNVSGGADAIRPDLYPSMLQSIPFGLYILGQPVKVDNRQFTVERYLVWSADENIVSQVRQALFGWMSSGGKSATVARKKTANPAQPLRLTDTQEGLIQSITNRVSAEIDKKTGVITITAKMPDPEVAATIAGMSLKYLTNYVTNYRTGKSRNQVVFLDQQVASARRRYERSEYNLSAYRDRNRSVFLNTAKIEEQRLQGDYLLAQSVYNELSKQLEQARIKVQEEAPVFQILEPARVPLNKSEPKRTILALEFAIAGAVLGFLVFFVRWFLRYQST